MRRCLNIYTNSSCLNNGKQFAKGGIGVYFPDDEFANISLAYPTQKFSVPPTNQRCELLAVNYSLVIHWLHFREVPCVIHTSSEYAVKSLLHFCKTWSQNGWKKFDKKDVKNKDLLLPMHVLFSKNKNIDFHIVKKTPVLFDRHTVNHKIAYAFARKGLGLRS